MTRPCSPQLKADADGGVTVIDPGPRSAGKARRSAEPGATVSRVSAGQIAGPDAKAEPATDYPIVEKSGLSAQSFHPKTGGARLYADSLERTMTGMGPRPVSRPDAPTHRTGPADGGARARSRWSAGDGS
ncbi:hypothetical protein BB341_02205 [Streptomyces clavuligerus]|nr:hypothetical protein BB341_02205 [Streptomyces clavuligerus]